jgi:hypothetical protein
MQITAIARKKIAKSRPSVSLDAHPLQTPAQGHVPSESHRIYQCHCLHLDLQRIVQSQASTICSLQPLVFALRGWLQVAKRARSGRLSTTKAYCWSRQDADELTVLRLLACQSMTAAQAPRIMFARSRAAGTRNWPSHATYALCLLAGIRRAHLSRSNT